MTRRNTTTTDKVRAVLLATIMVVSVFGGTVAFAGSAAATANSSSFAANVYAGGEDAQITVTDTSKAGNEELEVTVTSQPVDEKSDTETVTLENTDEDSVTFEGSITTEVISSPDEFDPDNDVIEGFAGRSINLVDDYDGSALLDAKAGAPSITDADIVGMRDGNTVVRVDFSEPVQRVDASDFEFTGSGSVDWVTPDTGQDGYVELTFDREIQTGTSPELVVKSGSYTDLAGVENAEEDRLYVDSVELELDEGMNFVSAPFETGGVGFSAMEEKGLLDNVDVVWAYDQSSPGENHWVSYDPDADENELEWFQGGQGYVFVAEKSDEIDLRSYTKYADNDDSDNVPAVPETEQIEPGWNLVGHYHEGSMPVDTAFGFDYDSGVGVLGQMDDGSMEYVSEANAGEAYWVFTRDSYGLYTPKESDGGSSTSEMELSASIDKELVTNGDEVEVTIDVTDKDGLYSVIVGASELGADSENTHLYDRPDDELESGTHTVTFTVSEQDTEKDEVTIPVFAEDVYGEEKTDVKTVELDAVEPTIDNFAPSDGAVANSAPTELTFDITDGGSGVNTDTLSVTVTDSDDTTELDSATTDHDAVSVSEGTVTITVGQMDDTLTDGDVTVSANVDDVAGNTGSNSATFTLDTASPSVSEVAVDDADDEDGYVTEGDTVSVSATVADATSGVESVSTDASALGGPSDLTLSQEDDTDTYSTTFDVGASGDVTASSGDSVSLTVTATDAASNEETGSDSATLDTTSPDVSNVQISDDGDGVVADGDAVTITADISDDTSDIDSVTADASDFGVDSVTLTDDGTGTYTETFNVDGESATEGDQSVTVSATDVAGNGGSQAVESDSTLTVDVTSPSASLSDVNPQTVQPETDIDVTYTADDSETQSVEVAIVDDQDNEEVTTGGSTGTDVETSITAPSSGGEYSVEVRATDDAGNTGTSSQVSLTVDDTSPEVSSVDLANDGGNLDLSFDSDEELSSITVNVDVPESGADTYTFAESDFQKTQVGDTHIYTLATDQPYDDGDGEYTASVDDAVDAVGNNGGNNGDGDSLTDSYLLDTTVDVTGLTASDAGSQNVDVTVESAEQLSNLEVSLSGAEEGSLSGVGNAFTESENDDGSYTYEATYEGSSDGDYTVSLDSAADTNDNTDSDTGLSDSVTIDTTEPSVSNVQINDDTDTDGVVADGDSVLITADVSDATSDIDSVTADATDFGAGSSVTLTDVGDGEYATTVIVGDSGSAVEGDQSVTVSATDTADNGGSQAVESGDTLTVDNVEPSASWTGYSDEDTISGSINLEEQTDLTTDDTSTTTYEYSTDDGDNWDEITGPDSWDTSTVNDGDITLRVTVEDGQDNEDSDTVLVTVDNSIDSALINSPTQSSSVTKNTDESVTIDYDAEDTNFDSATVELVDGENTVATASGLSSGTSQTTTIDLSSNGQDVSAGTYTVELTVDDSAGNSKTVTQTDAVTVDDGNVDTASINSPTNAEPTAVNEGESVTVDYNANDANFDSATVELVDSSGTTQATEQISTAGDDTVTIDTTGFAADDYDVVLTVDDTASNSESTTESNAVSVDDGTAPSMTDATQSTTDSTTTVTVTLSDAHSGLDSTSIEQADFSVDTGTITDFDASGISDGDNSGDVTITLDSDYSGQDITVSLTSNSDGISDMAGNSAESGTATATSN